MALPTDDFDQWSGAIDERTQQKMTDQMLLGGGRGGDAYAGLDACSACAKHPHPSHKAASSGHIRCLRILNARTVALQDETDDHGATPLYYAAQEGHLNSVKWLVRECNADPLQRASDGMCALHAAAQAGRLRCLRFLFKNCKRSTFDSIQDSEGATPLHVAAGCGHVACLKYMLQVGGSGRERDAYGGTPLHDAAEHGRLEAAQVLAAHRVDLAAKDMDGLTPRALALEEGHNEVARFLAQAMARVDRQEAIFSGPGALNPAPERSQDQPESDDDEEVMGRASNGALPNLTGLFEPIVPAAGGRGSEPLDIAKSATPTSSGADNGAGRSTTSNGSPVRSVSRTSRGSVVSNGGDEADLLEALDDLRLHMDRMAQVTSQLQSNRNSVAASPVMGESAVPLSSQSSPSTPAVIRSQMLMAMGSDNKELRRPPSRKRLSRQSSREGTPGLPEMEQPSPQRGSLDADLALAESEAGQLAERLAEAESALCAVPPDDDVALFEAQKRVRRAQQALFAQQERQLELQRQHPRGSGSFSPGPGPAAAADPKVTAKSEKKRLKEEKRREKQIAKDSPKGSLSGSPRTGRWSFFSSNKKSSEVQ